MLVNAPVPASSVNSGHVHVPQSVTTHAAVPFQHAYPSPNVITTTAGIGPVVERISHVSQGNANFVSALGMPRPAPQTQVATSEALAQHLPQPVVSQVPQTVAQIPYHLPQTHVANTFPQVTHAAPAHVQTVQLSHPGATVQVVPQAGAAQVGSAQHSGQPMATQVQQIFSQPQFQRILAQPPVTMRAVPQQPFLYGAQTAHGAQTMRMIPKSASWVAAAPLQAPSMVTGSLTTTNRAVQLAPLPASVTGSRNLPASMIQPQSNAKNNILLMTDAYKFSHHKQYPVSWIPPHIRPSNGGSADPPILFQGAVILGMRAVPTDVDDPIRTTKITIITNVSTAVVQVEHADAAETADFSYSGRVYTWKGEAKPTMVISLDAATVDVLRLPATHAKIRFANVDESKLKRGSALNSNFEGGHNVSYFTPREYNDKFSDMEGDNIVFFGLQYFLKEYLTGKVVTRPKIDEADAFIGRYMADVRVAGNAFEDGYDYTMFPRGDWEAMLLGDYDATGNPIPSRAGVLPVKVEALPEGTLQAPGVCSFKITNTHPRFFWLPNFLETLLVQVWYPMTVATQTREFKKTIQAYGILSQRMSPFPADMGPPEFTEANLAEGQLSVTLAQVFDLLDFGYRGVSSHETASLGASAYYSAGYQGSDTVAGSRLLLQNYNFKKGDDASGAAGFQSIFEQGHGATSVPAAEHSTITSWADVSPTADHELYEQAEYNAFTNMIKQYMSSFCVSLVSDGFNIWNAIVCQWPSEDVSHGGESMRSMLAERLAKGQLTLMRPDSGEGVETLPQIMTLLYHVLNEHWEKEVDLPPVKPIFRPDDPHQQLYNDVVARIRALLGMPEEPENLNPFRRCIGQQLRVLQGDGVSLDTVGDMLASLLANGFSSNCVHFGSGGGLLQKVHRDSLGVAFKCCAMYVGDNVYSVGKDPIAGGKKSYGGNPAVIRYPDGVLRNRGDYDENGTMITEQPMTLEEFQNGAEGDELRKVFENGVITEEQDFNDVMERSKITQMDAYVRKALENLAQKLEFFQKMGSDESIAIRIAEASCGAKWAHSHPTKLHDLMSRLPAYAPVFEKLGISPEWDSTTLIQYIKDNLVCDRQSRKFALNSLAAYDAAGATAAMGDKFVLTL